MSNRIDLSVTLPLSQLTTLLNASQQVPGLMAKCQTLETQVHALRGLYQQLLDKVTELNRYV